MRIHTIVLALAVAACSKADTDRETEDPDTDVESDTDTDADTDSDTDSDTDADTDTDTDADTDTDTDTDTDADADADTDTDSDADTDTDTHPSAIDGSIVITTVDDGVVVCDVTYTFTGTPYAGTCDGCDFAFDISSAVTDERETTDCDVGWLESLQDGLPVTPGSDGIVTRSTLAWWSTVSLGGGLTAENLLALFATGVDYGGGTSYYAVTTYEPDFGYAFSVDVPAYGYYGYGYLPATRTADGIDWAGELDFSTSVYPYVMNDCGTLTTASKEKPASGLSFPETVACDDVTLDRWAFTGDGGIVTISVDTTAKGTGLSYDLWANDASGCTQVYASADDFSCTYTPASGAGCPVVSLTTVSGDTYTVTVKPNDPKGDGCLRATTIGDYAISAASSASKTVPLTLDVDDGDITTGTRHERITSVDATSTLTP